MHAFQDMKTARTIKLMARRSDNPTSGTQSASPRSAILSILDWDEGNPPSQSWLGVAITYLQPREPAVQRGAPRLELDLPSAGGGLNR
jgi:hypothetical protein